MTAAEKQSQLDSLDAQIAPLKAQLATLQAQRDVIAAIVSEDAMTPYLIDPTGKKIPLGNVAMVIDPTDQRAHGWNIGVDSSSSLTMRLTRPGYDDGSHVRPSVNGVVKYADTDYRFSAAAYTLTITGQGSHTFTVSAAPAPAPQPTPTPPAPSGNRWKKGMNVSLTKTAAKVIIAAAVGMGVTWIRPWIDSNGWDPNGIVLTDISAFHGHVDVFPVVTSTKKLNYAAYYKYAKALLPKLVANGTKGIQVGNELHYSVYGAWTVAQALELMKAFHDARRDLGLEGKILLYSCSSFDMNYTENLLKGGMAALVDGIDIHYYPTDARGKIAGITEFVGRIRKYTNLPIMESEENIHWPKSDLTGWAAQQRIYFPVIATMLDSAAYFYGGPTYATTTQAGPAYLFENNGAPHGQFFDNWKNA